MSNCIIDGMIIIIDGAVTLMVVVAHAKEPDVNASDAQVRKRGRGFSAYSRLYN